MTHAEFAAKLLQDAATFFRHIGDQNPPLKEQMESSAQTYDLVAELVERDPGGELVTEEAESDSEA